MEYQIKYHDKFRFVEEGDGDPLVLLHGLFGALSNFEPLIEYFRNHTRVIVPMLPLLEMDILHTSVGGLAKFVHKFLEARELDQVNLLGNSLGGHVALLYTLHNGPKVDKLILTGSSGLFENAMGGSYPRRGSYDYIKERVAYTFYDPNTVSKELVDEVFETTKSIPKCMRIVAIAKSAQRNNLATDLPNIKVPTLLVWGLNDTITPPSVAYEFNRLIPNATLSFVDRCCHAPMMEHPEKFNEIVENFLTPQAA